MARKLVAAGWVRRGSCVEALWGQREDGVLRGRHLR